MVPWNSWSNDGEAIGQLGDEDVKASSIGNPGDLGSRPELVPGIF